MKNSSIELTRDNILNSSLIFILKISVIFNMNIKLPCLICQLHFTCSNNIDQFTFKLNKEKPLLMV